jgi:cysteinyl-tRNA synthetase
MLKTHHRQPIDWTVASLDESHKTLWEWSRDVDEMDGEPIPWSVLHALYDDLNTPQAISELHKLQHAGEFAKLKSALHFLGFSGRRENLGRMVHARVQLTATSKLRAEAGVVDGSGIERAKVDALVSERSAARSAKNWAESDRIRDELAVMGIALKDNKDGTTTWEPAR